MELHLKEITKCYICDKTINGSVTDILKDTTDFSHSLIYEILEKISGHTIINPSDNQRKYLGCSDCIDKVNQYDFASIRMEKVQKELISLLQQTNEKYCSNLEVNSVKTEEYKLQEEIFLNEDNYDDDDDDDEITYIVKDEGEIITAAAAAEEEKSNEPLEEGTDEYEIHFFDLAVKNNNRNSHTKDDSQHDEPEFVNYEEALKTDDDNNSTSSSSSSSLKSNVDIQAESSSSIEIASKSTTNENNIKLRKQTCKICRIDFPSFKELCEHRKNNHNNGGRLVCDICGVRYKTHSALTIHINLHNGISPFKCEICGKRFTQKGALKRHQAIHTGERPYQCDKCGKQFTHYSSFHMHNLAHDDIRNKKCEICGLLLRSSSHLNRHMLVHTGQKPHECPKCGKRFAQRYNMMSHLRSHQGIYRKKKYTCLACNKGFAKEEQLNKHIGEKRCSAVVDVYQIIDDSPEYREGDIVIIKGDSVS